MKKVLPLSFFFLVTSCATKPPPNPELVAQCINDCNIMAMDCRYIGKLFEARCLKAAPIAKQHCVDSCNRGEGYHFTGEKPISQIFGIPLNTPLAKQLQKPSNRKDISFIDLLAFDVFDIKLKKRPFNTPTQYYVLADKKTAKVRKVVATLHFKERKKCEEYAELQTVRLATEYNIQNHSKRGPNNSLNVLDRANTRISLYCTYSKSPKLNVSLTDLREYSRTVRKFNDNNNVYELMIERAKKMFPPKKKK